MPYSDSVSMNRNIPKAKRSPKWRPKQSVDTTRFLEKPNFTWRTGKLVDVLYGRRHCYSRDDITLLCTYFVANKRHKRFPKGSKSFVQNETSSDNFYSDKRKLRTTTIETEPRNTFQKNDKPSAKINAVLKDLGFVCNTDKMYTFYPSQILYYYKDAQTHITRYGKKNVIASKPKNSIGNSDGYNQNEEIHQKPNHFRPFPENNRYNKNDKIENLHQNSSIQKFHSNPSNFRKNINNFQKDQQLPTKYWLMRHLLFTNFDRGILLDTESFYSVCPEILSNHIAKRCKNNIVLDPFCGAGGNIIQLAKTCKRVIACDIDPNKIRLARHNAEIYGVAHKIDFVVGDIFQIYTKLKADVVFMSPPWGGPGYSIAKSYSLTSMCNNYFGGGFGIFHIVKTIAPNIAFHMPKTTNILECMWLAKDFGKVEIQQNIINGRLNSITAFYGNFH